MTPRPIAVAVVVHAGRVLVGRRADDAPEQPGRAEFPGGKVEPHETSAAAAERECREETGIAIRVLGQTLHAAAADGVAGAAARPPVTIAFHRALPLDSAATPRPPFAWVPISELPRLDFPPANAAVLAMLAQEHAARAHGGS